MTVLVTGASGFVGMWLSRRLAEASLPVVAQMRKKPAKLFEDLSLKSRITIAEDPDIGAVIDAYQPTTVYHLAGMSQIAEANRNPVVAFEANARSTWQMLEALRKLSRPARCMIASTDSLYGETGGRAATESDPLKASGPYETSKHMSELAARSFAASYGLAVTIARLGNIYGPGDQNGPRIIPSIITAVKSGQPPQLRGGGRAVRTLLHVDDCIEGLQILANAADQADVRGAAFNLSGATAMTVAEIARTALDAFGRSDMSPIIIEDAPGETSVKISDSTKMRTRFGWSQKIALHDGLAEIALKEGLV